MRKRHKQLTDHAKELRANQTKAESLVWTMVRNRRTGGLKFRRQYPIPPYIADFACVERKLILEIDGGYHDMVYEQDQTRQRALENQGWTVLRFGNEDVLENAEGVAISIARALGVDTP